ncbi:hypothetical protein RRG08_041222, partial [Elysia crispata]
LMCPSRIVWAPVFEPTCPVRLPDSCEPWRHPPGRGVIQQAVASVIPQAVDAPGRGCQSSTRERQ